MKLLDEAVRIDLFGTDVYAFGLYCAIGAAFALIACGVICRMWNMKKGTAPLFGCLSLILGAVCGRLVFCLTDMELGGLIPLPAWFRIEIGGWSLFGVMGGVFFAAWLTAKLTGQKPLALLDTAACVLPLFITAERLAEARIEGFNISRSLGEDFPDIPFLTVRDEVYGVRFLATYHLAAVLAVILFLGFLLLILRDRRRTGDLWILFLMLAGAGGILLESLRYDHFLEFSFVRFQQVLAAMMLVWGVLLAGKGCRRTQHRWFTGAVIALIVAVGVGIGVEFALDRTRFSHVILYILMIAALAVPVAMGIRMMKKREGNE